MANWWDIGIDLLQKAVKWPKRPCPGDYMIAGEDIEVLCMMKFTKEHEAEVWLPGTYLGVDTKNTGMFLVVLKSWPDSPFGVQWHKIRKEPY